MRAHLGDYEKLEAQLQQGRSVGKRFVVRA
jgi:hypothetical protein